ncbi:MAG TPA: hypothetical protein VMY37_36250 [Thermoguttaceae bacterium]|nr:hypothetical protein [Thermoguttaceae bacterium]
MKRTISDAGEEMVRFTHPTSLSESAFSVLTNAPGATASLPSSAPPPLPWHRHCWTSQQWHPAHLEELPNLQQLYGSRDITDAGLEHVARMTNLQALHLDYSQVTDSGVEHLGRLKNLNHLDLTGTSFTREGLERLHRALPNCEIEADCGTIRPQAPTAEAARPAKQQ